MTDSAATPARMPDLGLLFDVDGPVASPITRTINIPSIANDLVTLAAAGVPIAFITGRSDVFIRDEVVDPLLAIGLSEALAHPHARMFGVFEKGAAWAPITASGMGDVAIDEALAFAAPEIDAVRRLVAEQFSDTMFFDETKRAMISVEQNLDVSAAQYKPAQLAFQDAAFALLSELGVGLAYGDLQHRDAQGGLPFRVDPTVISTDIESVLLDKDRGTRRALEFFEASGPLPRTWRSVGDSRSDYKMADQLYREGYATAHVDVRPADGVLDKPYPVLTHETLTNDEAGAAFLRGWVTQLGLDG